MVTAGENNHVQESNSAQQKQITLKRPTQGVLLPILLPRLSILGPIKKANRASCMCSYSLVRRTGRPTCHAFEVQMFTTVSTNEITSAANSPEDRDIPNINH